jgi:hypothetical protein
MHYRYYTLAALLAAGLPARAQQPAPGWQVGLRLSQTVAPWQRRGAVEQPGINAQYQPAVDLQPVLVGQRNFRSGAFARVSLSRLPLPSYVDFTTQRGDTSLSYGTGFVTFNTLLRLEAGHSVRLSADGRTRLLGAAGLGLLLAGTPGYHSAPGTDTMRLSARDRRYWQDGENTLVRQRRVGGLLSLRLGMTYDLRWRDVLSVELAYHQGLAPVYRSSYAVQYRDPTGPQPVGLTLDTRGSFWEFGLGYHWQAQKKKLGLVAYPEETRAGRQPWQPLPARGLYLTGGMRAGVALARQGREEYAPTATVFEAALPVFSARLGYQWPAGWLAEAGPQTAYAPLFAFFDPTAAAPASQGSSNYLAYELAPQHGPELTGWPLATAWALMGGRRWALRPDRWYATAKAGAALHHYTGPAAFGYTDQLIASTPTQDYSEFSYSFALPARWRVLAQVEAELETRISRRTLLGLQLAYAARPTGRAGADQTVISWYYNGQAQVPVVAYSRQSSLTVGLQLRRVLHL